MTALNCADLVSPISFIMLPTAHSIPISHITSCYYKIIENKLIDITCNAPIHITFKGQFNILLCAEPNSTQVHGD